MHESPRTDRSKHRSQVVTAAALVVFAGLVARPALAQVNPLERTPPPTKAEPMPPVPPPATEPNIPTEAQQAVLDAHVYDISAFVFRYAVEHADMPTLDQLMNKNVTLGVRDGVYVSPRPGVESVTLKMEELSSVQKTQRKFAASAINIISLRVVDFFNEHGLVGVAVIPAQGQLDPRSLEDLRPAEQRTLVLDIWVRTVKEVRTLGAGPRWSKPTAPDNRPSLATRINHPVHEQIRDGSPVQPGDLLRKDDVEHYIDRLDRQPGRRIDATVAAADAPGDVILDYVVTENRPWTAYFQFSNTGTEETQTWRERFGFIDNQLTNRDDILSIDYLTAGFTDENDVLVTYDAPLLGSSTTRVRVYGSASDFTASDVGFPGENFEGDSWNVGAELVTNIVQHKHSFVDLFGGARWENVHVKNEAAELNGNSDFFIPYAGLRFERNIYKASTSAELRLEANAPSIAHTEHDLDPLGRLGAERSWIALKWNIYHSFYLEPLIHRDWGNPDAPYRHSTLAHEIALSFRGQNSFGNRLIPQEEQTIGGLYTVRGYPESLVAGDDVYIASAEYRFHLPRFMAPGAPGTLIGRPFRYRPEDRNGSPDWDLVLKAFLDVGRATGDGLESATLVGAGVGAELSVLRNLSFRLDWGVALKSARDVNSGDNRLHFVGTILY